MLESDVNLIEVVMAIVSIGFMGVAVSYAYRLRTQISKAMLITAISKNLYRHLGLILGFSLTITIIHFLVHVIAYYPIPLEADLLINVSLDLLLILVSASIYMTFREAYGLVQVGQTARKIEKELEKSLRRTDSHE